MPTVLFLGPPTSPVLTYLRSVESEVGDTADPLNLEALSGNHWQWLVSHGYRHILRKPILDLFPNRAINLHISILPWNRGADPNLWSWIDRTPKGVTIHHIDEGIDTGDIIAQREVQLDPAGTLATTYAQLQEAMLALFIEQWPLIRSGKCERYRQLGTGSYHRTRDRAVVEHLLTRYWDTPVHILSEGPTRIS